jgi:sterol 3beta-glucosyltransferase
LEVDDFEEETPRLPSPSMNSVGKSALQLSVGVESRADLRRARSGSVNTVRVKRRARLAEKLKEVFELSSIEEVQAGEHACIMKYLTI